MNSNILLLKFHQTSFECEGTRHEHIHCMRHKGDATIIDTPEFYDAYNTKQGGKEGKQEYKKDVYFFLLASSSSFYERNVSV